ncbi:hypothetical protein BKA57DRAFT_501655 [Linnemannia elongata]|nr:hypothetical protein BKA57DRAFT_501655 [Linnemannia elongata]
MTMLTRLKQDLCGQGEHEVVPKATLTHACWIIDSNPSLMDLKLIGILLNDPRDAYLLTASFFRLLRFQTLQADYTLTSNSSCYTAATYNNNNNNNPMTSAATRFFELPELVAHLTQHLDSRGISRLMRTSRRLHQFCTPAHYYKVSASYKVFAGNLFGATESTLAFAKNVHHVRHIDFKRHDIVYYTNCVTAFLDLLVPPLQQNTAANITINGNQPTLSRPAWLAPPDPRICTVLPIPPMTLLTKMDFDLSERLKCEDCPYYLPSYQDSKATITQVCWIIDSNPHLLDVTLTSVLLKDLRDARLLTRSISGLRKLEFLSLELTQWEGEVTPEGVMPRVGTDIFFACSPTLREMSVISKWDDPNENLVFLDECVFNPWGTLQPWEKSDEECGLTTTTPTRQEPLEDLKSLLLGRFCEDTTEGDLRSMLRHCPNLTTLVMPAVSEIQNVRQLAKEGTEYCPRLTNLSSEGFSGGGDAIRGLLLWMLGELPPQQVTRFHCGGIPSFTVHGLDDAGSIFRRHSSTLREILLNGCQNIDSKAIQAIVVECGALERLTVQRSMNEEQRHRCLKLEDAIEFPWACNRIKSLLLTIAIPDTPLNLPADLVVPYYRRRLPITLSAKETQQFRDLESFYRQLGALTELERLDLRALFFDPSGDREVSGNFMVNTFPGMFSLGKKEIRRPGYLQLLGGLTKLKELYGSICLAMEETEATVGMDEVVWMDKHWPALERAGFFWVSPIDSNPFSWFQEQRQKRGRNLDLSALY